MQKIIGISVSPGAVVGTALVVDQVREMIPRRPIVEAEVKSELSRFQRALESAKNRLQRDYQWVEEELGPEPAKIFAFHLGLLEDQAFIEPIRISIKDNLIAAASAVSERFHFLADRFRGMGDPIFRDKAKDVVDLEQRLLREILGTTFDQIENVVENVVLFGHHFAPAEIIRMDPSRVIAIVMDGGGKADHASIVASSLGIPVIVGCQNATEEVQSGQQVLVDGRSATIFINPDEKTIESLEDRISEQGGFHERAHEMSGLEAITADGVKIRLDANIEFIQEIKALQEAEGEGVGLYRSEFTLLTREEEPSEEELYSEYIDALRLLQGKRLTIRTYDLGADKFPGFSSINREENPVLGLRSIRYCLANQKLFRTQLRAILRASCSGSIRIMFPFITTIQEFRQAKEIVGQMRSELIEEDVCDPPNIPLGIMIEVPGAALLANAFVKEVDFFSIGTNDLIQYTLGVDRTNQNVSDLYSSAHPAILKLIRSVAKIGDRTGIEVGICGEMAADPVYTMLLIGLGIRNLSLIPSQIPVIKRLIRTVEIGSCERLAKKAMSLDSHARVLNSLRSEISRHAPEFAGVCLVNNQ